MGLTKRSMEAAPVKTRFKCQGKGCTYRTTNINLLLEHEDFCDTAHAAMTEEDDT